MRLEQKISGAQQVGGKMSRKISEGVPREPGFFILHQGQKVKNFQAQSQQTADLLRLDWQTDVTDVNTHLQGCVFKVFSSAGNFDFIHNAHFT